MKPTPYLLLLLFLVIPFSAESSANQVLLEINGTQVTKDEFLYIYEKNNPNVDENYDREDVEEYLDLFIKFKLKVHAAKEIGLDTLPEYRREYEQYRRELSRPYLTDREKTNALVKEAYERMKEEVHASHILIRVDEKASPSDTKEAYQKLMEIRKKHLEEGVPFGELASEYSEDPSAAQNQGDLGFFSVFTMTYPFESAVYNLQEGGVSMPFRTSFGYHLAKLHERRPAKGEIEVAHVMISPQQKGITDSEAKRIADSLHAAIEEGASFETIVTEHSDDIHTRQRGGKLERFSINEQRIPPGFVEAAFSLENNGDISAPVQTQFGWHILKRVDYHTLGPFEEMQGELRDRVRRGDRSEISKKAAIKRIKEEQNFSEKRFTLLWINRSIGVDESLLEGEWAYDGEGGIWADRTLFTIGHESFNRRDFAKYLEEKQGVSFNSIDEAIAFHYDQFVNESILDFQERNLEELYPEFRNIIGEYRDGLLLFEVMEKKVWNRASEDTTGLKEFYENNMDRYATGDEDAPPLEQIRGRVIADYQDYLEKEWLKSLRTRYEISVNDDVINEIIN